ncbi:hypothetical protein H4R18_003889 [Coemansia javaensis]|uniref:RRM domain-containing protein n=1 Tax=Coemansia javaensis TaxID=2761396 RepID=A0A9W8H7C4_9FUNG|nr:hypothetical protein H4R18_003889 [Coemansia javaensis]
MGGARLVRDIVIKHSIGGIQTMEHSLRLLAHLRQFGTLTSLKFMRDPLTSERTGLAFASYLHYDEAAQALRVQQQTVDGLPAPFNTIDVTPFKKQAQDGH